MNITNLKLTALALLAAAASAAHATEGGNTVYPNGAENFLVGALPPPGWYGLLYATHYHATRVNDDHGDNLHVPGFKVDANVVASRLAWLPGVHLLGGELVGHVIVPVVDLDVHVAGQQQHKTGLGDITTGVGLGFHHSPKLHSVVAFDVYVPVGDYSTSNLANLGRNHWAFEPVYAVSYVDAAGFNADVKAGYIVNLANKAVGYRSGGEFHFDYSAGWGVGAGWTTGLGGYVYQQVTDDHQHGATLANDKASVMAIGPSAKYDSGKGWFATFKWEAETRARNRTEGNSFWLKAVFPL